jgi:uncharacterized membrane protein
MFKSEFQIVALILFLPALACFSIRLIKCRRYATFEQNFIYLLYLIYLAAPI